MKGYRIATVPLSAAILCVAGPLEVRAGITFGQVDDFQTDVLGWQQGAISPNPPTVIATGGPTGANDPYLQNVSNGTFGAGGRQVMRNTAQWAGNYVSAGVTRITANLANFGTTPLSMRVWVSGGSLGGQFSSSNGIGLPADSHWHAVTFDLSAGGMTAVSPTDTLTSVLSHVSELRIMSASAPGDKGDIVAATLGADDIRATTIPGDANHDNSVSFTDLLTLAQHYGNTGAHWEDGDFNFDGTVNFTDLLSLAQNYGSSVSWAAAAGAAQATPVPEPALALGAAGMFLMTRRRRSAPAG